MQNENSDIDFFIRWIPEEERDKLAEDVGDYDNIPEDYCQDLIRYFEQKGTE